MREAKLFVEFFLFFFGRKASLRAFGFLANSHFREIERTTYLLHNPQGLDPVKSGLN